MGSNLAGVYTRVRQLKNTSVSTGKPLILILPAVFAVGGVERNTIGIVKSLLSHFDFLVITNEPHTATGGCLLPELEAIGITTIDLAALVPRSKHLEVFNEIVINTSPDLVWICNGSVWLHENMPAFQAMFLDTPVVNQEVYDHQNGWIQHLDRSTIETSTRFVAINSRIKTRFSELGLETKTDLIFPAIELDRTPAEPSHDNNYRFAFIGRLSEQKRPHLFIEMAASVASSNNYCEFSIYGDGVLRAKCEQLNESLYHPVKMHGYVTDLSRVYQALGAVVFTSAYEGLPIAALEALASGVPIFATAVGDLPAVASEYGGCYLVAPELTSAALAKEFEVFLKNRAAYAQQAASSSQAIRDRFSTTTVAADYRRSFYAAWQTMADRHLGEK